MSTSRTSVSILARDKGVSNYLKVRYTKERRPQTKYPAQLCRFLYQTYIRDRNLKSLLDLGCGRGDFLKEFKNCGLNVTGIDNSNHPDHLLASQTVCADIDGKKLPFEDESFDVVFSKSVIEHIHDTDTLLSESYRLLKPGGINIIMTPDWSTHYRNFFDDYTHVKPFTKMGLDDVVLAHDFTILESRYFRQLPFLWARPYFRVFSDILELLPDYFKKSKVVKFSKEWMLLVVAEKQVVE
ncbi:MAG: class I SAM-dependent methyltransferase [Deltaproteobacteria bacterium]|nr:class I SAM-dependent methyltransferase [Deltaproteobacteria bacterium]